MKKFLFFALSLVSVFDVVRAQTATKNAWSAIAEKDIPQTGKRQIVPQKYLTYRTDPASLKEQLFSAPNESRVKIGESPLIVILPLPDGSIQKFRVVESPVMAPELSASFPGIKTFSLKGVD